MNRTMPTLLLSTLLLPALPLCWGCLPSSGEVEVYSDSLSDPPGTDAVISSHDGGALDRSIIISDGPTGDSPASPGAEQGTAGGPHPPFGAAVGMTAANFVNIPDCDDTPYALHDHYNKQRGVLIAMMSPS